VFGFANQKGSNGFAGLAAFSDMQILLFPVATHQGVRWVTAPQALRLVEDLRNYLEISDEKAHAVNPGGKLNLGWLYLETADLQVKPDDALKALETLHIPSYITSQLLVVSDKLFSHVVNNNLEVRTSVAINPATGAAEGGALFTYEAIPRATVLYWEVICKNPAHFKMGDKPISAVTAPDKVYEVAKTAHAYLEHLGIGGSGSRGMGRLRVLGEKELGGGNG
jgi:CRISPR-associated protein Cmr4